MNQGHPHQPEMYYPQHQYQQQQQYSPYGYSTNGAAPPAVSNPMPAPQNVLPVPSALSNQGAMQQPGYNNTTTSFDTTGQAPPPGMKPRVTATLWEDEGSLCFQVEARGICVARREDNHMINGTKLLNVAGMTRGRRDGILKSEKVRHVVKIGPMHLKGVWIPYDRALDFANKEKITELLYPLFVHNIGALLYHPTNSSRTTQVMAAAERRKHEGNGMRTPAPNTGGLPSMQSSIGQHHPMMPGLQNGYTPQPLTSGPQTPISNGNGMLKRGRDDENEIQRPGPNGHDPMGNMPGMANGYAPQPPLANIPQPHLMNGTGLLKRGRDDENEIQRPGPNGHDPMSNIPGLPNGYAQQPPILNGDGTLKRGRDEDDDVHRSSPNGHDSTGNYDLKRRRTTMEGLVEPPQYYNLSAGYGNNMMNGAAMPKRGRDEEDEIPRPGHMGHDVMGHFDLKRSKTMEASVTAPQYDAMGRHHSSVGTSPTYATAPVYDNLSRPASTVAASPSYGPAPGYDGLTRPASAIAAPRRQQSFGN
ncbi:hypothetical protein NW762_004941 [Fusarium torreyae]|uniref:HTH APSES-type domain-containing protein n=1 Tax=Fusarium torreyae TaxID=1237075 RepID=A0A9W8S4F4_9HYPO|nr:hypothetical protein NW762_004941 [Fusarium torreyae]